MKRCSQCGINQELAQFYKRKNRPDLQPACKSCYRVKQLADRYGLTKDQYNQMVTKQKGKCAMCYSESKLHVDHSHETGQVRWLLCSNCNTALGLVKENIETLSNMITYVNFYSVSAASNTDKAPQVLEKVG